MRDDQRGEVDGPGDADGGVAGASARAVAANGRERWSQDVRARHPHLGRLILSVASEPQRITAWDKGAAGEERIGARLDAAAPLGVLTLHDRLQTKGRKANIDHLVVAPSGVWVVDAKHYSGRLERRDKGTWRTVDERLYVDGRDRSSLLQGVSGQAEKVSRALADADFAGSSVRAVLCFTGVGVGRLARPFELAGVLVTWPKRLVTPMVENPVLSDDDRRAMYRLLSAKFPPAA